MKILLAYDGSSFANAAIEDLRRAGIPEKSVAVVLTATGHTFEAAGNISMIEDEVQKRLAEAETLAETAANQLRTYFPDWKISVQISQGPAAKRILDANRDWRSDLIVVGSHGRSRAGRLFMGSVSLELIHNAPCSVRVVRLPAAPPDGPIRIVVATDGSEASEAVLKSVSARVWPANTEVRLVGIVETLVPPITNLEGNTFTKEAAFSVLQQADELERARLRGVVKRSAEFLRKAGVSVAAEVFEGDPREIILSEASRIEADAIFVGARGLGRMERLLLGSVSTYIVNHAHCTVEVVRP